MGTNYFATYQHCECQCPACTERIHICKSLVSFRGYRQDPKDLEMWPDDTPPASPWGDIASWSDWRAVLLGEKPGPKISGIVDEYGSQHEIAEFIARIDATEKEDRRRQYDAVQHYIGAFPPDTSNYWLDPDGYSFYGGEFS